MTTIAAKRCSNCQWKHDKIYCRGRKRHGDFIKFIKSQLKYCAENNYLHAMCAVSLREKQLYLQRIDPRMTSILGDFVLVPNTEPVFNLDSPDTAAYFYKTAMDVMRAERKKARAKEWEQIQQEARELDAEWDKMWRDWIQKEVDWKDYRFDFNTRRSKVEDKKNKFQEALGCSDDDDDEVESQNEELKKLTRIRVF